MTTSPPHGSDPTGDEPAGPGSGTEPTGDTHDGAGAEGGTPATPEPDRTQVLPAQERPTPAPAHRAPRPVPGAAPAPADPTLVSAPAGDRPEPSGPSPETEATSPAPTSDRPTEDATVAMPVTPTTGDRSTDPPDEEATVAIPTSGTAPSTRPGETDPRGSYPYGAHADETRRYDAGPDETAGSWGDRTPPTVAVPVQPAPSSATVGPTTAGPTAASQFPAGGDAWSGTTDEQAGQAEDIFPESMYAEPPSRAGSHWWGLLIALALSPISWFLLMDGSARIYWSLLADPANVNVAGFLGLVGGLLLLAVVLLAARWSSVGSIVAGSISALAGLSFLVLPVATLDFLAQQQSRVESFGGFGRNLYAYAVESGLRGTFLVAGVVLVLVGVVSHGARRKGRREEKARLAVRAAQGENPFA